MTVQSKIEHSPDPTLGRTETRDAIKREKAIIRDLYASIQAEVSKHRAIIDNLVFTRADQALDLMNTHGLQALTDPETAALIYDSITQEVDGLEDVEETLTDILVTIPFVTGFTYIHEDQDTGNCVPVLSLSVPDYSSESSVEEAASRLDKVLQTHRALVTSPWVHVDIEKSSSTTCFIRVDEHGYSLAKGDPYGLFHIKIGPVCGTKGLSTILREISLTRPSARVAS